MAPNDTGEDIDCDFGGGGGEELWTLKMEEICSSETSVTTYRTTQIHKQEDHKTCSFTCSQDTLFI
jgi:hypothetical protein